MKKKDLKLAIIAIVILGIIVGSYMYHVMAERPVFVLKTVGTGNLSEAVSATGKVVPDTSADLSFERSGKIVKIDHAVGDQVKAGEVLASLDGSDAAAQLDQAKSQADAARGVLKQYQENLKSAKYKLKALKADSTQTYNDKQEQEKIIDADGALVDSQTAQVAAADANVKYLSLQAAKNNLTAPFDGTVSVKDAEEGETVAAGAPMFTLISPAYKIEAYFSQADVAKLKIGDSAQVSLEASGSGQNLPAKVTAIDPSATQMNGVSGYKVTLKLDADAQLRAGLDADVSIKVGEHDNVVTVFKVDVIEKDNESYVMVPDARGKETLKKVQTGISSGNETEIVSGLSAGDQIFSLQGK